MSLVAWIVEKSNVNHHPSIVGITIIFMSIHDPRTYFLKCGLPSNLLYSSIYKLCICEWWFWRHVLWLRSLKNRRRVNIALFPLLGIILA